MALRFWVCDKCLAGHREDLTTLHEVVTDALGQHKGCGGVWRLTNDDRPLEELPMSTKN